MSERAKDVAGREPILVVWIHGNHVVDWKPGEPRGWDDYWGGGRAENADTHWWESYGVQSVRPRIDFPERDRSTVLQHEADLIHEELQAEVARERAAKGIAADCLTVYWGDCRGGALAVYAAQRDPWAAFVMAQGVTMYQLRGIHPYIVAKWQSAQQAVMRERAAYNPPGIWLHDEDDKHTTPEHARQLHEAAGAEQAFAPIYGASFNRLYWAYGEMILGGALVSIRGENWPGTYPRWT